MARTKFSLVDGEPARLVVEYRAMYKDLFITESRHHTTFVNLANNYAPREEVKARLEELSRQEAEIVARLPVAPRMH